jgi:sulfide:quinone oxidoreductase
MSRVVILGAGIAGHTAALFLRQKLSKKHEVVVVTPNSKWNWIPSNIWVGVGRMTEKDVTFELDKVYKKQNITYIQAKAVSIHPEGGNGADTPYVTVEYTGQGKEGQQEAVTYDYMINATGPKLNFAATEGLGPDKFTTSVCTASHATHANQKLQEAIQQMKAGNNQHILIGLGHGMATCQGAAFEYIFNVEYELRKAGVRDKAKITYISNESVLGDFGVGGMHVKRGGYMTHSKVFTESLFSERGVGWITGAHVEKVEEKTVHYELLDGTRHTVDYDMAMLIPPFSGHGLKAFDASGADITEKLFAPNGFMKVDADYTQKPYEEWKPSLAKNLPESYLEESFRCRNCLCTSSPDFQADEECKWNPH